MPEKKSFVLYADQKDIFSMLSDEQAGKLIKSIFHYFETGEKLADADGMLCMASTVIINQIIRDSEKYEEKKRKNAEYYERKKRLSENSVTEKSEKTFQKIQNLKKLSENSGSDNVNENGNENVNVNVNENDDGNGNVNDNVNENDNGNENENDNGIIINNNLLYTLTGSEKADLISKFGKEVTETYIERLNDYSIQHNKKYSNPYRTLLRWMSEDKKKGKINLDDYFNVDMYKSLINKF